MSALNPLQRVSKAKYPTSVASLQAAISASAIAIQIRQKRFGPPND
jgi:hypothetical protein